MIHVLKYWMLHFCDIVLKFFYICFNIFFIYGNTYFWLHGVFLYICFSIFPHVNSSSWNILQFSNHYPVIHIDFFICKYIYCNVAEIYHTCCIHFVVYIILSSMLYSLLSSFLRQFDGTIFLKLPVD